MEKSLRLSCVLAGLALMALVPPVSAAEEHNGARRQPASTGEVRIERVIVKLREGYAPVAAQAKAAQADAMRTLAARTSLSFRHSRQIASNLHVLQVESTGGTSGLAAVLRALRADESVEFAEPDRWRYLHAVPNDVLFPEQWYLGSAQPSAVDAERAWDLTTGSKGVVIAVIDTGVRFSHPDLRTATQGRLLDGYDFVSNDPDGGFLIANDGDGRDPIASDPGDWVTTEEVDRAPFDCAVSGSSWHGTRVAGLIGALTNNGNGIAGLTWDSWILPVRALGKCGGYDSDILAAMRWAAGLSVPGVPSNPHPAHILNLSIGSTGSCPQSYRSVISELSALGVIVVASAGNEGGPVAAPANCPGVIGVAGLRHAGTKVGFSNLGPEITVGAPGGNCVNVDGGPCLFSLVTTTNSGSTTPGTDTYTDAFNYNVGTSFSAPIVSGIVGLMLSVNGNLRPPQVIARLKESATPYPTSSDPTVPMCRVPFGPFDVQGFECNCTTETCGAGMANARKAVEAALRPIAAVAVSGNVSPGQEVTLDAGGSTAACGRSVASYWWTVVDDPSNSPISGADTPTATVLAPASGSFTVRLTVTDDAGRQDTADVIVRPTSVTTTAPVTGGDRACLQEISFTPSPGSGDPPSSPGTGTPPPSSGGGGGGGFFDWLTLLVMMSLVMGPQARSLRRSLLQ